MIYRKRVFSKTKEISKEELIEKFNDLKFDYVTIALLFGSRANGTYNPKSDYDFAILVKDDFEVSWGSISKVWNDIGAIFNIPEYDYDIVDLAHANRSIINSIKDNYILLKGDEKELQRLFNTYN